MNEAEKRLEKAGYRFVGRHRHSAVKVCLWAKRSLLNNGFCYKQQFYGISSHRCLQMTPNVYFCTHKCAFCWRDTDITFPKFKGEADRPEEIVKSSVEAHKKLLMGFKGNKKADGKSWRRPLSPSTPR